MIDNKVKNRIIGIEKIPASVDEDFHDSTILYINYSPGDYYGQADIALKTCSHENDETHDIIVVFHLEVEDFPSVALVSELHIVDSLASCYHHLIKIAAPYLRAWCAMADNVNRQEIVVLFTEETMQACYLARSA